MEIGDLIDQKVRVHINLNNGKVVLCQGGLVVAYVHTVQLRDAFFSVSDKGRARSIEKKKRTVHAWVWGWVTSVNEPLDVEAMAKITYNPAPDRPDRFHVLETGKRFENKVIVGTVWVAKENPHDKYGYAWMNRKDL